MTDSDREILNLAKSILANAETQLFDHIGTTFRWLMATLFAANAGAILALLEADFLSLGSKRTALSFFAAGLLISLLMGALSTLWGQLAYSRLFKIRMKVEQSLIEGKLNDEIVPALNREKPTWKTWTPSYAGAASFGCLVLGVLSIARAF
jgi:hypothetical protein